MDTKSKTCGACGQDVAMPSFTMAFQPIVDIHERRIYGYEALVRGPEGQSASSVLSQINAENRYAFDQACRVKAIHHAAALGLDRKLSINFMPNAVYEPKACIRATLAAANEARFPLNLITFEITEDERIRDTKHLQRIITEYRNRGFRVALDDFGSEYAGLSSLSALDVDAIKLDIVLIKNIDRDQRQQTITLGMIKVCQDLKIDVVAEGVERPEELSILHAAGVRYVQGYLLARPAVNRLVSDGEIPYQHIQ
ncbi:MAG: EAL domain-containing protein [Rhodospirillaceae bacterium]|nr:EAL domain-containing protein [Rhodospirillaceae bacterium]